jgi:SAM-dependent methyltransferase
MSKLSDLIKFRSELVKLSEELSFEQVIDEKTSILSDLISSNDNVSLSNDLNEIITQYQNLYENNQAIIQKRQEIIKNINLQIENAADELIQNSAPLTQEQLNRLFLYPLSRKYIPYSILSQLYSSSNLIYPGLLFGRISVDYINYLVASDPLYLCIDIDFSNNIVFDCAENSICENYLQEIITVYPELYQKRLRLYNDLHLLPKNQFSIILIWDFFHHIHYTQILDYLKQMIQLLRPGGSLIFSYNNFDIYEVAKETKSIIEDQFHFASKQRLEKDCKELGYEISMFVDEIISDDGDPSKRFLSWAKISKPGTLSTVKLKQAMGEIKRK